MSDWLDILQVGDLVALKDGRIVEITAVNHIGSLLYPIAGRISAKNVNFTWTSKGEYSAGYDSELDLATLTDLRWRVPTHTGNVDSLDYFREVVGDKPKDPNCGDAFEKYANRYDI
jgi:hypothetical protein